MSHTVEKRSTVPKFGDWDENDPTSADNFTGIFKKVRDERKDGGKPPMISTDPEFEDNLRRSGKTSDTVSSLLLQDSRLVHCCAYHGPTQ
ncbi:unnamed protein product [Spirodela intermedia]|uniref:RIN4 pathogenic type III effector avirulence factor Avr cleavage site domain-containing protein n=1 Tax=Spirodela intermedia TaxID=51605 RepID=A0A7I8L7E9_SPIIN|nr:unnamed protein product [Spirodela intermedia]